MSQKRMENETDDDAVCGDCGEGRVTASVGCCDYREPYFRDRDTREVLCSGCAVKILNLALAECEKHSALLVDQIGGDDRK